MPSLWMKKLAAIVTDPRPTAYTYAELASLLVDHLGFTLATPVSGYHRRFRRRIGSKSLMVGLVEYPEGPVPAEFVVQMIRDLRENELLPEGVE